MTKVSTIIVNYNTKELTLDCIDSVLEEGDGIKKEIIIVDNASSDDSLDALRKLQSNSLVTLIENKQNLGFAKANNQGIRAASGEYILLLNSDTKVKKNAIKKLVEFAKVHPEAGAVGAKLLNPDGSVQACAYPPQTLKLAIRQYWLGEKGLLDKYVPNETTPSEVDTLVMAAFLITPRALKKVGILNEKYFMYFEDLDYCRVLHKSGFKIYYLPDAEVIHYHGSSGKKVANAQNQWRRLIPSSKIYHGILKHYLLTFILWSGQKLTRLLNR